MAFQLPAHTLLYECLEDKRTFKFSIILPSLPIILLSPFLKRNTEKYNSI